MLQKPVKEAIELLIANGYVVIHEEKLSLTDKILEVDTDALTVRESTVESRRSMVILNPKTKSVIPAAGEKAPLVQFIIDCEIPIKTKGPDGTNYWSGKYNKEAEIEFKKILLGGYDLEILKAATKLYYKSGAFPEAISNFITRGTWLTHYMEMENQLKAGTVNKHIQSNLNDQKGGASIYDER